MRHLTPSNFLTVLAEQDIRVSLNGAHLHVDAPTGSLTAELRALLIEHKPQLQAHLRQHVTDERPVNGHHRPDVVVHENPGRLDSGLVSALRELAEKEGISLTEGLNRAIEGYLN
jgi:hypothetical protein